MERMTTIITSTAVVGSLVAAWAFTGFMDPGTMVHAMNVESDCIGFAQDKSVFGNPPTPRLHN